MKELAGSPMDDNSYELWVLQGLRALLGDEKAQRAMVALQSGNPAASEQIMAEAQQRYDTLSPEQKEAPQKVLVQISVSVVNLKFKMAFKRGPKGILMAIPKLLKSIFLKR
jgi:uncharacterized protein (DUF1800 family)